MLPVTVQETKTNTTQGNRIVVNHGMEEDSDPGKLLRVGYLKCYLYHIWIHQCSNIPGTSDWELFASSTFSSPSIPREVPWFLLPAKKCALQLYSHGTVVHWIFICKIHVSRGSTARKYLSLEVEEQEDIICMLHWCAYQITHAY